MLNFDKMKNNFAEKLQKKKNLTNMLKNLENKIY